MAKKDKNSSDTLEKAVKALVKASASLQKAEKSQKKTKKAQEKIKKAQAKLQEAWCELEKIEDGVDALIKVEGGVDALQRALNLGQPLSDFILDCVANNLYKLDENHEFLRREGSKKTSNLITASWLKGYIENDSQQVAQTFEAHKTSPLQISGAIKKALKLQPFFDYGFVQKIVACHSKKQQMMDLMKEWQTDNPEKAKTFRGFVEALCQYNAKASSQLDANGVGICLFALYSKNPDAPIDDLEESKVVNSFSGWVIANKGSIFVSTTMSAPSAPTKTVPLRDALKSVRGNKPSLSLTIMSCIASGSTDELKECFTPDGPQTIDELIKIAAESKDQKGVSALEKAALLVSQPGFSAKFKGHEVRVKHDKVKFLNDQRVTKAISYKVKSLIDENLSISNIVNFMKRGDKAGFDEIKKLLSDYKKDHPKEDSLSLIKGASDAWFKLEEGAYNPSDVEPTNNLLEALNGASLHDEKHLKLHDASSLSSGR